MKNKKAWLRIVEAVIAILVIISAVLFLISEQKKPFNPNNIYEREASILNIITKNDSLREDILNMDNRNVESSIFLMVPSSWNYTTTICDLEEICNSMITPKDREIYASEALVTSTLNEYKPKKLRLFVWIK